MEVFKTQLQSAALREQQTELSYEKRLEYLNNQLKQMQARISELEKEKSTNSVLNQRDTFKSPAKKSV